MCCNRANVHSIRVFGSSDIHTHIDFIRKKRRLLNNTAHKTHHHNLCSGQGNYVRHTIVTFDNMVLRSQSTRSCIQIPPQRAPTRRNYCTRRVCAVNICGHMRPQARPSLRRAVADCVGVRNVEVVSWRMAALRGGVAPKGQCWHSVQKPYMQLLLVTVPYSANTTPMRPNVGIRSCPQFCTLLRTFTRSMLKCKVHEYVFVCVYFLRNSSNCTRQSAFKTLKLTLNMYATFKSAPPTIIYVIRYATILPLRRAVWASCSRDIAPQQCRNASSNPGYYSTGSRVHQKRQQTRMRSE